MESRTAIVFGATGLVGRSLVTRLLASDMYKQVKIFVRQPGGFSDSEKLRETVIDFSDFNSFSDQITGDDLYIAVGTTIKKAGSVSKMEETDRDLPVRIASVASANRVSRMAVVSSIGANESSPNYYLRIKGEMEKRVMALNFRTLAIARPSLLLGEREESRRGEGFAKVLMKVFGGLLAGRFRKYRPIEASDVAKAMIFFLLSRTGKEILESDILQRMADDNSMP